MPAMKGALLAALAALAALATCANALVTPTSADATATTPSFSFGPRVQHAAFHADAAHVAALAAEPSPRRHARPLTLARATSLAVAHAAARAGVDASTLRVTSAHTSATSGTTHVYLRQHVNGLDVAFAEANVSVDKRGNVVAMGEALYRGKPPATHAAHDGLLNAGFAGKEQHAFAAPAGTPNVTPAHALAQVLHRAKLHIPPHVAVDDTLPFTPATSVTASAPGSLGAFAAIRGVTKAPVPVALEYVHVPSATGNGSELRLAYAFEVDAAHGDAWFTSHACASTGAVLSIASYVADYTPGSLAPPLGRPRRRGKHHAPAWWQGDTRRPVPAGSPAFNVYPIGCNDPDDGCKRKLVQVGAPARLPPGRDGAEEVTDPGWLAPGAGAGGDAVAGAGKPAETAGNNVVAELNPGGDDVDVAASEWPPSPLLKRRRGKASDGGRTFDAPLDLNDDPSKYADAAVAQLFYTVNAIHDIVYRYGFTEAAGNFQLDNLGRGGVGADPVLALAQDGSGYNNANFATPPDGKSGRMRMYVWNTAAPYRDGDLESGIVAHEMMHGITTRLTGGRMNSGCLAWGEAGGMGEGWGDVLATLLRMRNAKLASRKHANAIGGWHMGKYASGGKKGIRKYPYAGDMSINPSVYSTLNNPGYFGVHAKGEVWAVMLLEVFWDLVDVLGFSTEWRADFSANKHAAPKLNSAGSLFMQILMDALQIQPCRPSFADARDAMLVAEAVLTGGKHTCLIWRAFARRGLGADAKQIPANSPWEDDTRVDGFSVPAECQ